MQSKRGLGRGPHANLLWGNVHAAGMGRGELFATRGSADRIAGGRLTVVCAAAGPGAAGYNLADLLRRRLGDAQAVAARRRAARAGLHAAGGMMRRGMLQARATARMSRNNAAGLIGEMIAEEILGDLGAGDPFYVKWRAMGSSTTRGIDLIFKKVDFLSANESKHLHDAIRTASSPAAPVSAALRSALVGNGDRRIRCHLVRLHRCEARCQEECRARGDERGRMLCAERQVVLEKAIANDAYALNAVVVFDAVHKPARGGAGIRVDAAMVSQFRNPVTAFLVGVDGLHAAAEYAIGVCSE